MYRLIKRFLHTYNEYEKITIIRKLFLIFINLKNYIQINCFDEILIIILF